MTADGEVGLQGLFSPKRNGRFEGRKLTEIRDGASYTFGIGENADIDIDLANPAERRSITRSTAKRAS